MEISKVNQKYIECHYRWLLLSKLNQAEIKTDIEGSLRLIDALNKKVLAMQEHLSCVKEMEFEAVNSFNDWCSDNNIPEDLKPNA